MYGDQQTANLEYPLLKNIMKTSHIISTVGTLRLCVKKEAATFKINLQMTCIWMQNLGKRT